VVVTVLDLLPGHSPTFPKLAEYFGDLLKALIELVHEVAWKPPTSIHGDIIVLVTRHLPIVDVEHLFSRGQLRFIIAFLQWTERSG